MKKKIFLLGAIFALMLSFTITASAEEIFNLTLDGMENERKPAAWMDGYNYDETYFEIVDEYIRMYGEKADPEKGYTNDETVLSMRIPFGKSIEGEVLIYYDIMRPSDDADCGLGVNMQFFMGNNRITSSHSPGAFLVGEWYNVMVHIDQENKVAYYRTKPASAEEWGVKNSATFNVGTTGTAGFKAYFKPNSTQLRYNRGEWFFDNIRVIQGLYLDEFKFMLDDTEITSVADITSAGTVKATFDAANYDLDYNHVNVVPDVTQFTPMVVAFDKEGMMLDCAIYNDVELEIYDNPGMEFGLDITEFREQLDGGTIRLYIWDSMDNMEAIFDEFVLPAE